MSVKDAILATQPTSYWPLDDLSGFFVLSRRDELARCVIALGGRHAFGSSLRDVAGAIFRRRLGERPNHPRRSAIFATLRQRADRRGLAVSARAQQCERSRRARQVRPLR